MTTSTLTDALSSVARRNAYNAAQTQQLTAALDLTLAHIPSEVRDDPTFCIALRGQGRYISINCMNSLLFRIPAYQDGGGPTSYDCHIIAEPENALAEAFTANADRITFVFQLFHAINIGLLFDELLALSPDQWSAFADACRAALAAPRTRRWRSNIVLPQV